MTNSSSVVHDKATVEIVSPAAALWNQRHLIASGGERIERLSAAIGRSSDFALYQWAQIMAFVLEFRPDTIIDVGRMMGKSPGLFLQTANLLEGRLSAPPIGHHQH